MANGFTTKMEGDVLVIRVPLDKKALAAAQPSATGKTKLVASSHGTVAVGPEGAGVKLAINVMIPNR
jgi:hypothetical protein